MPPDMRAVYSDSIAAIGHDPQTNELFVQWKGDKKSRTSVYSDVPAELARQVSNAPSVGQALHQLVKANYPHKYL